MKKGFTLAEILITLGIIGVVAALTAPSLVQNAGNAKIGPTLQKTVSTIEIANQQMLVDEEASTISAVIGLDPTVTANLINFARAYAEKIAPYISGSSVDTAHTFPYSYVYTKSGGTPVAAQNQTTLNLSNGVSVGLFASYAFGDSMMYAEKGSYKGNCKSIIMIDINGSNTLPNTVGKDIFSFALDMGGKLVPVGSRTFKWLLNNNDTNYWDSGTATSQCNSSGVGTNGAINCAGSIFDNNLKVIYK